ncbi:hypothetical protein L0657_00385 [Dyadobacter sp. CY345]|uniref:hypothetical protein n=1 Tax=Dyadobacter sp. CY345 TaxID=2909335 RepID=UPI001F48A90D|nr:hypothetical protein [Dyadobacter sp. CY345]MCF2442391.1 hypothetical protein [Dyadobacter sp. CY345]
MIKYLVIFSLTLLIIGTGFQISEPNPTNFSFAGQQWYFPSTVQEAVKKHKLNYKPPGYYYQKKTDDLEVVLDFHYKPGDFYNEYQPKEILFPRKLHSYIFIFEERAGVYDSLRLNLEKTFNNKFHLVKGIKDAPLAIEKEFEFDFLTVSPNLTIGIKRSPPGRVKKTITLRFMYNLPINKMGVYMGSY